MSLFQVLFRSWLLSVLAPWIIPKLGIAGLFEAMIIVVLTTLIWLIAAIANIVIPKFRKEMTGKQIITVLIMIVFVIANFTISMYVPN